VLEGRGLGGGGGGWESLIGNMVTDISECRNDNRQENVQNGSVYKEFCNCAV
jgi:hypothetical protein